MTLPSHADSIYIERSPADLYAMVSDVTRMGEWSPVTKAGRWDDGATAEVGAWFFGRNETPDATWETRCQIVAADPGREFAFVTLGTVARWGYSFEATGAGTTVTESWEFLPGGIDFFRERFGDDADRQIDERLERARTGIPQTLAELKAVAESTG
ncbi:MAG: SRPBCC family protein [Actinomycetota bacterium]|nr:SRPBCC family protein [Actinomycetota bacterium]